jgi:hypothetical protein
MKKNRKSIERSEAGQLRPTQFYIQFFGLSDNPLAALM